MPSAEDPINPRDPAAFRAAILRRATRIERTRRISRAAGWSLVVIAVVLSGLAFARAGGGKTTAASAPVVAVSSSSLGNVTPAALAGGADGNLWVTAEDGSVGEVIRVTVDGARTVYPLPPGSHPEGIEAGVDGALWFTDPGRNSIGRITTDGTLSSYRVPETPGETLAITPDGAIWFVERPDDRIGKLTPDGRVAEIALPVGTRPDEITVGPDGGVWFTELGAATLGRVAATGSVTTIHLADPAERATWVATGPGPAIWFVTNGPAGTKLARVDTTGHTVEQSLSGQIGPAIGLGPDGRLWVASAKPGAAWTATQSHITEVHLSEPALVTGFAAGSDGNLWFVGGHVVGHIVIP